MRANHIPRAVRLKARIDRLILREDSAWQGTFGNPYKRCRHCHIRSPQLSIEGDHRKGCPLRGIERDIAHYKSLLTST